jgi:hypothetical protein
MPSEYDYVREPSGSTPGTWLGLSIASTVCCCTPFGIVGIVFSGLAMGARDRNEMAEMERHLSRARGWTIAAIICGIIGGIIVLALRGTSDFN